MRRLLESVRWPELGARRVSTPRMEVCPSDRPDPVRMEAESIGTPRLRGWLHAHGFVVAVLCSLVLCVLASALPGQAPLVSCAIYSVTLCGLLGVSALYHRGKWTTHGHRIMRRLDHSMIFLCIAGTYTPFCVLLLPPDRATTLLATVGGGALAGVALKLVWSSAPRWLSTLLYIGLGWVAIAVLPDLLRAGGQTTCALLLIGGVVYSLGGMLYALRRPNPWPATFGHHELFHACTLVAATCHHVAVYFALYSPAGT